MADRPLINESLTLLTFGGLITYENNSCSWRKFRKILFSSVLVIGYIDVLLCAFVSWNEPESIQNVLAAFHFSQIMLKMVIYKSRYLLQTLKKMQKFYPLHKADLKLGAVNGEIFAKIESYLKSFLILFSLVLALFFSKTFLSPEKQLPMGSFFFSSKEFPIFESGYLYEVIVILFTIPVQVGYDILYISIITNIVYEFRLLKRDIAEMPINGNSESDAHTLRVLGNLINHHNVILNCSKALRRAYYIPFLCIFMFNMVGIGFCLLCIITSGIFQNIGVSILYGTCTVFYTVQLLLYCAPGTILIFESTEVSDVIFNTDWWIKTQSQLRKTYVRILQRANKPVLLSAGGMMNVTLETFNRIVKSSLSFFTCVLAMYRKNA